MEKDWAQKAGIGWIGKHTNLITKDLGSWIFLGEILLDIELDYDNSFTEDLCGTCTACLDACPTNAFPEPYVLDASKCISYLTIEHRGELPPEMEDQLSGWIYGCDICQEVCPWNITFSQLSNEKSFQPRENLQNRTIDQWRMLNKDEFRKLFKNSAVKRTKYKGLKRNIDSVRKSFGESV
jgi:epoxyqueuosine reductase